MGKDKKAFQIFYDGACYLCSTEIDHYRKKSSDVTFEYIDISAPEFNATSHGLDNTAVQKAMHVKTEKGEIKTGIEAFFEIWRRIPSHRKLAWALDRDWLTPILRLGYSGFARIRVYLPKRKGIHCESGTCGVKPK